MKTLEEVRTALKRVRLSVVASETGLHVNTLRKIVREDGEPSYDTVKRLSDWIESIAKPSEVAK